MKFVNLGGDMDTWDSGPFKEDGINKIKNVRLQWEGEDEEEDVAESWDQEEDERKEEPPKPAPAKKINKKIADKLEEKDRNRKKECEETQPEEQRELTPEEILADKLRRQKLQEDSDLNLAKEIFGASTLETKEDFDKLKEEIMKKIGDATKNNNYAAFTEELVHGLCVHLSSADIKKVHIWLGNLHIEKNKLEKGEKIKKPKGKGKVKLKLEDEHDFNEYSAYTEDYDDFI